MCCREISQRAKGSKGSSTRRSPAPTSTGRLVAHPLMLCHPTALKPLDACVHATVRTGLPKRRAATLCMHDRCAASMRQRRAHFWAHGSTAAFTHGLAPASKRLYYVPRCFGLRAGRRRSSRRGSQRGREVEAKRLRVEGRGHGRCPGPGAIAGGPAAPGAARVGVSTLLVPLAPIVLSESFRFQRPGPHPKPPAPRRAAATAPGASAIV